MTAELAKVVKILVNDMSARRQGWRTEYTAAILIFRRVAANPGAALAV
jgi:hypothetical protein